MHVNIDKHRYTDKYLGTCLYIYDVNTTFNGYSHAAWGTSGTKTVLEIGLICRGSS